MFTQLAVSERHIKDKKKIKTIHYTLLGCAGSSAVFLRQLIVFKDSGLDTTELYTSDLNHL